jgi:hypothetical protein
MKELKHFNTMLESRVPVIQNIRSLHSLSIIPPPVPSTTPRKDITPIVNSIKDQRLSLYRLVKIVRELRMLVYVSIIDTKDVVKIETLNERNRAITLTEALARPFILAPSMMYENIQRYHAVSSDIQSDELHVRIVKRILVLCSEK